MSTWDKIDELRLREMRASGVTVREIATELGLTAPQVRYCCKVLDIPCGGVTRSLGDDWEKDAKLGSQLLLQALRRAVAA